MDLTERSPTLQEPYAEYQLLNYKQASKYLSLSEVYLRKLKRQGHLPYVLVGDRAVRFRVGALNRWIQARAVE